MYEYIFRGKRIDNGEWVEGFLYCFYNFTRTVVQILTDRTNGIPDAVEVDPETVGQYTWLKDKNGKRIFEGDIVYVEYDRYNFDGSFTEHKALRGAIGYDSIGMIGIIVDEYEGSPVWADFFNVLALTDNIADWSIEVIGNIHDNPELLKEGKI